VVKVAITGGVGSGKSTVARMFKELGAVVLDADELARAVVAVGTPAWEALRRAFGPEFFRPDGSLDRGKMAHLVFHNPEARRRLNDIVHPQVAREMARSLADLEGRGVPLVLVEVPLLFECRLEGAYDRVIVVYVPPEVQVERAKRRDRREKQEIAGILAAQWPLEDKRRRADYVVDNRGSFEDTRRQVSQIWRKLEKILLTRRAKKDSVEINLP
jgi:dephospho-CoA kinase